MEQNINEQFDELRKKLATIDPGFKQESLSADFSFSQAGTGNYEFTSLSANDISPLGIDQILTLSPVDPQDLITMTSGLTMTTGQPTYTTISGIGNANAGPTISIGPAYTGTSGIFDNNKNSGLIKLGGENPDIQIGEVSLMETLKTIQERLNILTPNKELESEWTELSELGNKYRELEKHIKDKMKTWEIIKKMPPPKID